VRYDKVALKRLDVFVRNTDVGESSEPRVDPVNGFVALEKRPDASATLAHALASRVRERDRRTVPGHRHDIRQGERVTDPDLLGGHRSTIRAREIHAALVRCCSRLLASRIRAPDDTDSGVVHEAHAEALSGLIASVGHWRIEAQGGTAVEPAWRIEEV
jgi:hypothetical protein